VKVRLAPLHEGQSATGAKLTLGKVRFVPRRNPRTTQNEQTLEGAMDVLPTRWEASGLCMVLAEDTFSRRSVDWKETTFKRDDALYVRRYCYEHI
jgi:hypothetical protein